MIVAILMLCLIALACWYKAREARRDGRLMHEGIWSLLMAAGVLTAVELGVGGCLLGCTQNNYVERVQVGPDSFWPAKAENEHGQAESRPAVDAGQKDVPGGDRVRGPWDFME